MLDKDEKERVAQQWADVAEALAVALDRWRAVSEDSDGPLAELYGDARHNAAWWGHEASGMTPSEARRATNAELGQLPRARFINYDPEEEV